MNTFLANLLKLTVCISAPSFLILYVTSGHDRKSRFAHAPPVPVRLRDVIARETIGYFFEDDLKFDPGYRNPCWEEELGDPSAPLRNSYLTHLLPGRATLRKHLTTVSRALELRAHAGSKSRLRCLPGVYVGGIYKGGTTDLYTALVRHPLLLPGALKEPAWHLLNPARAQIRFRDYVGLWDAAALRMGAPGKDKGRHLAVDGTTGLIHLYRNWETLPWNVGAQEPEIFVADHLKVINPGVKVIFMLRKPSSWLESCVNYYRDHYQNLTADCVHEKVIQDMETFQTCTHTGSSLNACVFNNNRDLCGIMNALYYLHIRNWVGVIGRGQVKVIQSESYFRDRVRMLRDVFRFLEVPDPGRKWAESVRGMEVQNEGSHQVALHDKTLLAVDLFMKPWNIKLSEFLADKTFLEW